MADYPAHGSYEWDGPLKDYIEGLPTTPGPFLEGLSATIAQVGGDYFSPLGDKIRLGVARLRVQLGASGATEQNAGNHNVWALHNAATEGLISGEIDVPAHWQTMAVKVRYINNTAAATGDVVLRLAIAQDITGDLTNATMDITAADVTAAVPATQYQVAEVTVATAVVVDPTRPLLVRFWRLGTNASDTFGAAGTGNLGILSISLERDS